MPAFRVVLDQMRTGNAQFTRPLHGLCHQFLVGQRIECASLANLAPINDQPENTGHADGRRNDRNGIAFIERDRACFLQIAEQRIANGRRVYENGSWRCI
jgi:hypothetical protein